MRIEDRGSRIEDRKSRGLLTTDNGQLTTGNREGWTLLALVGFPLLFLALLLWVYPFSSVDLYDYLFRGRMLARYGANTFTQIPQNYSTDPLFDFVAWRRAVTAYGPLLGGPKLAHRTLGWRAPRCVGMGDFFGPTGVGTIYVTNASDTQLADRYA